MPAGSGLGCRDPSYLRRDEVPSSRLASLDTSERNYWVARVPRTDHPDEPRPTQSIAVEVTDVLRMSKWDFQARNWVDTIVRAWNAS